MKAMWDPSILLWSEITLQNHAYLDLAEVVLYHLERLEVEPVFLLVPKEWEMVFQHFPFADRRFHPEATEINYLFWNFMSSNTHRILEVGGAADTVVLQPDVCPQHLPPAERSQLLGFFGGVADQQPDQSEPQTTLLTADKTRFERFGNRLHVILISKKKSLPFPIVADSDDWEWLSQHLDYRPDVLRCIEQRSRRYDREVTRSKIRPFSVCPSLLEQLAAMSSQDVDLYWEIIDSMARWVAGLESGLKAHKISRNIWRIDVRKGAGDKIHAKFSKAGIEFIEYHADHDRYKIN